MPNHIQNVKLHNSSGSRYKCGPTHAATRRQTHQQMRKVPQEYKKPYGEREREREN